MRKTPIIIGLLLIATALSVFGLKKTALSPHSDTSPTQATGQSKQPSSPTFDKKKYPIDKPDSIWTIANKARPLRPVTYAPTDLRAPNIPLRLGAKTEEMQLRTGAASALETMTAAAKKDGASLKLASGYRSYNTQVSVYANEVKQYGQAQADKESARPGHSEHQTGLAADLQDGNGQCVVADCFKDLPEGKWVAAHAWEYGFIIRYVPGKESITGYRYEPWHIRFVGKELAKELHDTNTQTLEEFFNVVQPQPY